MGFASWDGPYAAEDDYYPAAQSGPREPLDEKDAEIDLLWVRIARLETVASAARSYLLNSTPVNARVLGMALNQAKGESRT